MIQAIEYKKRGPQGPSKYTDEFIEAEADALIQYCNESPIPFLKDFCGKRGYHSGRISEFRKNYKFSEALNIYKDRIETQLAYGAMTGKLNATFVIFALKNIAGWRDQQHLEHNGPGGEPLPSAAPIDIKIITVEGSRATSVEIPEVTEECQPSA